MMKTNVYEDAPVRSRSKRESASSDAEVMKRVEAAGTPGPSHKALDAIVGEWTAEVKCWMDPDGPPDVSRGTASAKWKFKGRFVEEEFHGQMMGKPFTGMTLIGFDNTKQTFNSIWVSDTQTSMFTSEGTGSKDNTVITLEGKSSCPGTGRTDVPMKTVLRVINQNTHVLEMYDESSADSVKAMEITYTRQ